MKFEAEGKLHHRREKPEGHCRVWFDPDEVEKVARDYKPTRKMRIRVDERLVESNLRGKIAAKALPMFENNATLAQICAATEADPLIIQQLYETWRLGLEGAIKRKEREKELERAETVRKEEERRRYIEKRQQRWCDMRVEVARLESKKPLALPKLDMKPNDEKKRTG